MKTTTNEFGMTVNILDEGDVRKTCIEKDCQKEFVITKGEIDWLNANNLKLFKRCPECRKKRKAKAAAEDIQEAVNNGQ